eukprot:IDg11196t1
MAEKAKFSRLMRTNENRRRVGRQLGTEMLAMFSMTRTGFSVLALSTRSRNNSAHKRRVNSSELSPDSLSSLR